jgi:hypothetical protein
LYFLFENKFSVNGEVKARIYTVVISQDSAAQPKSNTRKASPSVASRSQASLSA